MCIGYAINYNLQIYVDWRDPMWSNGSEDFYTYFKLINMPVLKSLADIPSDATYYPTYWKGNLDQHITYDFVKQRADDKIDLGQLRNPYDADVVVSSNVGVRTVLPSSTFFAEVFRLVDPRVISKIQHHMSKVQIDRAWGIHIRGTDHIHERKRSMSIQAIVSHVILNGGMNKSDMIAVSDDKENLEIWRRFFPKTYVVSQPEHSPRAGAHTVSSDALGITKDQLNVDVLVDFFIFAMCERRFSTVKGSRFRAEADRLHPVVNKIINGS